MKTTAKKHIFIDNPAAELARLKRVAQSLNELKERLPLDYPAIDGQDYAWAFRTISEKLKRVYDQIAGAEIQIIEGLGNPNQLRPK